MGVKTCLEAELNNKVSIFTNQHSGTAGSSLISNHFEQSKDHHFQEHGKFFSCLYAFFCKFYGKLILKIWSIFIVLA